MIGCRVGLPRGCDCLVPRIVINPVTRMLCAVMGFSLRITQAGVDLGQAVMRCNVLRVERKGRLEAGARSGETVCGVGLVRSSLARSK